MYPHLERNVIIIKEKLSVIKCTLLSDSVDRIKMPSMGARKKKNFQGQQIQAFRVPWRKWPVVMMDVAGILAQ